MKMKVLQVVGYKKSGKTTLVCELVRRLSAEGQCVGTLKRDAHDGDPEPEGADTRRHREAGARITALASDARTLWLRERATPLEDLIKAMENEGADAVLIEGFKTAPYPKIVLLRGDEDADLLQLSHIIAVALRNPAPAVERAASNAGRPVFRTDGPDRDRLLEHAAKQLSER